MPAAPTNIVLVGFMGSGKSEVGRRLADRTARTFIDTDDEVEADGVSIPEIFASEGERGFRERERQVVGRAARSRGAVIATGGGAVLDPANVKALKRNGVLVYLKAGAEELARRLGGAAGRPLLAAEGGGLPRGAQLRDRIDRLLADRAPIYESVADHVIACDGLGTDETADVIVEQLRGKDADDVHTVRVKVDRPHTVHVGRGLLSGLAGWVSLPKNAEKVGIVSHPRIKRLWGSAVEEGLSALGRRVSWVTFPEGEDAKTVETAARISRALAKSGFHRDDALVALGGGVVGDVTGYVASTYVRGIPYVQIPTTLLAMVDASIGGKTGVNLPQGKNLVGSFYHPMAVVADIDVLTTLPDRELRGGLAEVVKTGFILDRPLIDEIERSRDEIFARGPVLERIVLRCARAKAGVVAEDPTEQGRRAILNYGHTLGHALEGVMLTRGRSGARVLHHGEGVSIGMVFAAEVASLTDRLKPLVAERHRSVLEAVGLPTRAPAVSWKDVQTYMKADKKYAGGVRMVLLEGLGKPIVAKVPGDVLQRAWERIA